MNTYAKNSITLFFFSGEALYFSYLDTSHISTILSFEIEKWNFRNTGKGGGLLNEVVEIERILVIDIDISCIRVFE